VALFRSSDYSGRYRCFQQLELGDVTAIEYGLTAAGIGVAILMVVNTVGGSLVTVVTTVSNDLTTAAK